LEISKNDDFNSEIYKNMMTWFEEQFKYYEKELNFGNSLTEIKEKEKILKKNQKIFEKIKKQVEDMKGKKLIENLIEIENTIKKYMEKENEHEKKIKESIKSMEITESKINLFNKLLEKVNITINNNYEYFSTIKNKGNDKNIEDLKEILNDIENYTKYTKEDIKKTRMKIKELGEHIIKHGHSFIEDVKYGMESLQIIYQNLKGFITNLKEEYDELLKIKMKVGPLASELKEMTEVLNHEIDTLETRILEIKICEIKALTENEKEKIQKEIENENEKSKERMERLERIKYLSEEIKKNMEIYTKIKYEGLENRMKNVTIEMKEIESILGCNEKKGKDKLNYDIEEFYKLNENKIKLYSFSDSKLFIIFQYLMKYMLGLKKMEKNNGEFIGEDFLESMKTNLNQKNING
jgi:hypothetical protein